MRYFPNGKEEIDLVKFIAKYQYLKISDAKYFFKSNKYYKNRIKNLIDKGILRRLKWTIILGDLGISYVEALGFEYNKLNRNKKYKERLLRISNLAAYYNNCNTISFMPSFSMKNKEQFTTTGRRFIGVMEINGIEYLTYYISKDNDNRYIKSVIYDMEREHKYSNFIILVNNMNRINLSDFATGHNSTLIIEDNDINRNRLKYMNSVNWYECIINYFEKAVLAEYSFCDYTDHSSKYISYFYFMDVDKLYRTKIFANENINSKTATIICDETIENILRVELPQAKYITINCDNYVEKRNYYGEDGVEIRI